MQADDELCLCFHVTRRKVEQYLRAHRPAVASQLSECYGAGTGCGWCRPYLRRLHAQVLAEGAGPDGPRRGGGGERGAESAGGDLPDASTYAADRAAYRRQRSNDPTVPPEA